MQRVAMLLGSARRETIEIDRGDLAAAARLSTSDALTSMLESWKREPVSRRFERLAMQASAVARRLGKPEPKVELRGNGIRLDSEGWLSFWAAMVHLVRNAVDHGIEDAAERVLAGKARMGTIVMEATRSGQLLVISVSDDGRGLDWARVRERARAMGLPADDERQLCDAIFHDGLSTRETASDVSGRGVGLAALAEVVREMGGEISVRSEPGQGTTMSFRFDEKLSSMIASRRHPRSSLMPQFV
jgi:two-component system chemotaxis sensor kinase CheA